MSNYFISYHGGTKPATREEGADHMAKWQAWATDLGDAMVNTGTPLGKTKVISSDGVSENGSSNPMSGYSIVKADGLEAALELVKNCPLLDIGGTLEVSEMMEMKP